MNRPSQFDDNSAVPTVMSANEMNYSLNKTMKFIFQ